LPGRRNTTAANKAWLRSPPEIRFEAAGYRFLLVHGSPRRINEYPYEDKRDATFARIAAGAGAGVIACGHTHRPYVKTVDDTRFVNDGSAGTPKDGDPRTCSALVETEPDGIRVDFRRAGSDVEAAARAIEASDLPDEFAAQLREARGYRAPGY
jgi:predicted phosphodiesterase